MGEGAGDWKSELSYSQRWGQPPAGSQLSGVQNQLSVIKARGYGYFPGVAAIELEDEFEIGRWGVALRLLGGPGEVETSMPRLCAWISSL